MRIRNVKNAKEIIENSQYIIKNPEEYRGNFQKLFGNDQPLALEIGMGKGDFLIEMAKRNPDTNFIGVERYDSIVAKALLKLQDIEIPNLKIIIIDALRLEQVFDREIDKLYLNFSDPWPKKRQAKRRLTATPFLKIYEKIFKDKIMIEQKTDNEGLFISSVLSFSENGFVIKEMALDITTNPEILDIETEYEKKFKAQGIRIKYLRVEKKIEK